MKLAELTVRDFVGELGSGNPTPGGGSAAALCGALGAALSGMVARLTVGREKFRDVWQNMEELRQAADELADRFLALMQEDTDAYRGVVAALKLPKETEGQRTARQAAAQEALTRAAAIPLETLRASERLIAMAKGAMEQGNPNTLTDAAVAAQFARAAAVAASYNVRVNLPAIQDETFIAACREEVGERLQRIQRLSQEVEDHVNAQLAQ